MARRGPAKDTAIQCLTLRPDPEPLHACPTSPSALSESAHRLWEKQHCKESVLDQNPYC